MTGNVVLTVIVLYGIWKPTRLWKQKHRREAIALSLISAIAVTYLLPVIGNWIPTTETIQMWIYKSLSDFVEKQINIVQEVSPK